jgi:YrbI family 3-deoxy-D-manno-octulosonate 8-phosphate phosphatase
MVIDIELKEKNQRLAVKAKKIKVVLTDNDGVLTDTGVYYSPKGEEFKRFSIRDGMGVERLKKLLNVETGIITGEETGSVIKRAEKLNIKILYTGVKKKEHLLPEITKNYNLKYENVAFIGDDVNDIEIMKLAGFTASPADAVPFIREMVDYICENRGGNGAFREFAELIIALNSD